MSVPQYRKAAAVALAAGLGLSLAACSTKSVTTRTRRRRQGHHHGRLPAGRRPEGAAEELERRRRRVREGRTRTSRSRASASAQQCNNPPDFTARLAGGTVTDVFYGYMTDLQQVLDSGQAMDITSYVNQGHDPDLGQRRPGAQGGLHRRRQALRRPDEELLDGPGLQQDPVPAGRARRRTTRRRPGPRSAPRPRRSPRSATASPATREYSAGNTGGWHFTAELYSQGGQMLTADGKKADFNNAMGKQVLQNLKDMRYADNSMGAKPAAAVGRPADQRRRRQGRHVHRRAGRHHRDRHPVPGQVPGLGDGPAARPGRPGQGHARRRRGLLLQEGPHRRRRSRPA